MHLTTNISHLICLLAGLFLVLTSFLLKDMGQRRTPATATFGGVKTRRDHRSSSVVRRLVLMSVGLVAAAYGLSRMLGY